MAMPSAIATRKSIWILGPKRDLLFFVLTPLLILPIFLFLPPGLSPQTLALYILGLGGFGHHLPGFIRAYADRDLFARHKASFTVAPVLIILACSVYSLLNLNALACLTVAWGTWHGAMQVNGFMRIYDAKVKSILPATARLDKLMCIAWFGLAILHSPEKQFSLATLFYGSGGILVPPWAFEMLRRGVDAGTFAVTLLFGANAWRQWKAGAPPSPAKLLILASSFGFWWFCTVSLHNLLLGVLMWEVFHDVQYNVLVWFFQRHRVRNSQGTGAAEKLLFGPGWGRLALYAGLILAYGWIGIASSFASVQLPEDVAAGSPLTQWLLRITLASALLHFYFDGFIWKVREADIRRDLGVQEGKVSKASTALETSAAPGRKEARKEAREMEAREAREARIKPAAFRPAWLWALFIVPAAYLGLAQHKGWSPDFAAQMMNLAEAIPGNWKADFLTGTYYKGRGDIDKAESHYRKAVAARPDFAMGHLFLGDILYKEGQIEEAIEEYRQSVELDPENPEGNGNLARLYLKTGQPQLAAERFQAALGMDPDNAELNYGMATALLQQRRLQEAMPFAEKTLRLAPNHSGALNCLGMILDVQGNTPGAVAYYRRALATDSGNASARENLAVALSNAGSKRSGSGSDIDPVENAGSGDAGNP
jgi:tetratricopeptide (TPR) repeat protein